MMCQQITTFSCNGEASLYAAELPVTAEADEKSNLEFGVVNLYPEFQYQTIDGFGGAITESSAYLLSKMDPETRKRALECYFGENGSHYRFVRTHIDSCDFSLNEYTAVEDPMDDPELDTFSLKRDKQYIIPILKEAIAISKEPLFVLLSPWSPPACWKTPSDISKNDSAVYGMAGIQTPPGGEPSRDFGGHLKPEYYGSWAKYMVKFVQAYLKEGISVSMLTIQNEANAATMWDSCVWTVQEEKTFLKDHLYPEMKKAGLTEKVGIFFWDHNKERVIERAGAMLDDVTSEMIEGIAFHWYSGDHFEAVRMLREKYPDKVLMLSECCEMHAPGQAGFNLPFLPPSFESVNSVDLKDAAHYAHDLIGNLNAGMQRWIDWNIILDKNGGPRHVRSGCTSALVANDDGTFRKSLIYYYIAHFSKYILPGAKRIGFSKYDDSFEMAAFKNPNGQIAAVFLNSRDKDTGCAVRMEGKVIRVQLQAHTITTILLE